jgi:hypothetical protein
MNERRALSWNESRGWRSEEEKTDTHNFNSENVINLQRSPRSGYITCGVVTHSCLGYHVRLWKDVAFKLSLGEWVPTAVGESR